MARPKATGELKTHQQHLLMAPSEVAAIDDWAFANRIRSRGEAIRRLCQVALQSEPALHQSMAAIERALGRLSGIGEVLDTAAGEPVRAAKAVVEEMLALKHELDDALLYSKLMELSIKGLVRNDLEKAMSDAATTRADRGVLLEVAKELLEQDGTPPK